MIVTTNYVWINFLRENPTNDGYVVVAYRVFKGWGLLVIAGRLPGFCLSPSVRN